DLARQVCSFRTSTWLGTFPGLRGKLLSVCTRGRLGSWTTPTRLATRSIGTTGRSRRSFIAITRAHSRTSGRCRTPAHTSFATGESLSQAARGSGSESPHACDRARAGAGGALGGPASSNASLSGLSGRHRRLLDPTLPRRPFVG